MPQRNLVSVVDDDESVRESLPDLLTSHGFVTRAFASAEAFLDSEVLAATACLVLDVSMPGMTGPELQIELAKRQIDVAIVFITAHADVTVEAQVLKRGAQAFLLKPFTEAAIVEAVAAALGKG
ncbi:MAG: response regulator [Alphaproteobacteria bacterium]|nr:response regulator [Alphaproteobacteria bacterium]MBU1515159.1 response regulator [Alphaproteobacteria bacterium]MBU2092289.1 response regulator [Alphaproteobacteria bacterium]MBU2152883.1 response regulator [Alphaproteobacteria bacterium]MBU2305714.1 response regulator [Alphaproteobacteria bacterium]